MLDDSNLKRTGTRSSDTLRHVHDHASAIGADTAADTYRAASRSMREEEEARRGRKKNARIGHARGNMRMRATKARAAVSTRRN